MSELRLTVNGGEHVLDAPVGTSLAHVLREELGLTGTKIACNEGHCGACTVQVDGVAALSCSILAVQADGAEIRTVEGLASNGELHPIQRAFHEHHGLQCGYCTPGMMMAAVGIIEQAEGELSERQIRDALEGNICRCTGYQNIVAAVKQAADEMARV